MRFLAQPAELNIVSPILLNGVVGVVKGSYRYNLTILWLPGQSMIDWEFQSRCIYIQILCVPPHPHPQVFLPDNNVSLS